MDFGKYIIVKYMEIETPILFPSFIDHSEMTGDMEVVSAGMFDVSGKDGKIQDIAVSAFGQSTTLNRVSRPEDADLIHRLLVGRNFYQ